MNVFSNDLPKYGRSLKVNTINLAFVSGGFVATRLLALGTSVLVARLAGTEVFGEFTLFMAVYVIAFAIGESLDTTFMRLASSPGAEGEEVHYHTVHISAKVLYAVGVSVAGWVMAPLIAEVIFHKPESVSLFRTAAIVGGLVSIYSAIIGFYSRRQRFFVVTILLPTFNLTVLAGLGGLAVAESSLNANLVFQVYVLAAIALAAVSVVRLLIIWLTIGGKPWLGLTNFFRVAAPLMGAEVVGLVAHRFDLFVLASYAAFADLGQYGVAIRISAVLAVLNGAFATILVPKAATAIHDRNRLPSYLAIGGFYSALFTVAAAALVIFIEPVSSLLFGEQYMTATGIAIWLIVKMGVEAYAIPFQAMIRCGPRPGDMVYLSVGRLVITGLLLAVFVPRFEIIGAAYAVAATSAIMLLATCATALVNSWPNQHTEIEEGM